MCVWRHSSAVLHMEKSARSCTAGLMPWLRTLYLAEGEVYILQQAGFILRRGNQAGSRIAPLEPRIFLKSDSVEKQTDTIHRVS